MPASDFPISSYFLLPPSSSTSYKVAKEAFHANNEGSSLTTIYLLSLPALSSLCLYYANPSPTWMRNNPVVDFAYEFITLVLPFLLGVTAFADRPLAFNAALLALALCNRLFSTSDSMPTPTQEKDPSRSLYPPLSTYRSHLIILTVLTILACDFPVFPRALGKTETFGWSLMDLGVGSFVFSGALTARKASVGKLLRKTAPLAVLGLARVAAVKVTEYPEHASEYGVHWNFFLTLACLPLLALPLQPIIYISPMASTLVGLTITGVHQYILSSTGLQEWALGNERIGLIGANKEGLTSLPGYLAIHLLGVAVGQLLPLPSSFANTSAPVHRHQYLARLFPFAIMYVSLFFASSWLRLGGEPSRRLANMPYVLHTAMYNTVFLTSYAIFFPSSTPPLLQHISARSLPLFLLANVLTGGINLSIETMYVRNWAALVFLVVYGTLVFGIAWVWR